MDGDGLYMELDRQRSLGWYRSRPPTGHPPMDFKFGRYIRRVHPNKSPLNFLEKRGRGRIQGLPKFIKYPYYLKKGQGYEHQILYTHIHRIDRNKSLLKISGKVAVGLLGDSRKFSGH